jgi:Spy/CpxP family protein refolding chaperone
MKKVFVTLAFAAACAFGANAQDARQRGDRKEFQKNPEARAQRMTQMMDKKLNLTDQQEAAVQKVNMEAAKDMQGSMESMASNREKMKAVNERREAEFKRILTPEQFASYQQVKAQRMAQRRQRMAQRFQQNGGERRMNQDQKANPVR